MVKCLTRILCVVCLCLGVTLPAHSTTTEPLVIGMFAYRPADQLQVKWQPFANYLAEHLKDRKVELRILDQQALSLAIERNELDVVFTNPTHYIRLRTQNRLSGAIATQVTNEKGFAVSELGGLIIRRNDRTDLQQLNDLKKAQIAITGRDYLGGYVAQAALLLSTDMNPADMNFTELGNPHDKIVEAVLAGRADAGFIRTGILENLAI